MMHKRTLHSLLIVSFIVAFASMGFAADQVIVQSKAGLPRCVNQASTVTANIDAPISALEVVLNVSNTTTIDAVSVTWNLPTGILTDRIIDLTDYPLIRFAAMSTGATTEYYAAGVGQAVATINYHTKDLCTGTVNINGATIPAAPPLGVIQTQFVDAATSDIRPVLVTNGVIGISNQTPTIAEIAGGPFTVLHGTLFTQTLSATDADLANGCENLTYFIQQGPVGMSIVGNVLSWTPLGSQVCQFADDIIIGVRDKCTAEDLALGFKICVSNNPPAFTTYPTALVELAWGMTYNTTLAAVDPDPGPLGPLYHLIKWTYAAAAPVVNVNTGAFTWATLYEPQYTGLFDVWVEVDDGAPLCECAPANADTIHFQIRVVPFQLTIEKVEDAYLGQPTTVSITMLDDSYVNKEIGGYDFLIAYDNTAMVFQYAEEGEFFTDCEWEYFTYRYGYNGNCGAGACPSGVLRVVAMGETSGANLAHHPICWTNTPGVSNELVKLHFLLSSDATLECQFAPIRFVWYDCGDNGVSSRDGEYLFISQLVYDFDGFDEFGDPMFRPVTGLDPTMPTFTGAPVPECDVVGQKGHPWRLVHYYNGGIDIICADSIDAPGDINLNLVPNEIADVVMFTNYFVSGLAAFGTHVEGSIAASDVNKDGITLSVADLVYMIRIIVGDVPAYDKISPVAANVTVGNGVYSVGGGLQMGAAHIVVSGEVTPRLLASNMEMQYGFNGQNTSIIIWSREGNSFTGNFLDVAGDLVSSEFATFEGQPVTADLMPANFELHQNYPNPFNPVTNIKIEIPGSVNVNWKLNVYNVTGQLVQSFTGASHGYQTLTWDASNVSSGVYFYKLTAGDYTATKKAVLLK